MAEDLQHLLEHIKTKGIDEAREEAEKILASAREEAEKMRKEAQTEIASWRETAKKESEAFQERAADSIRQAARDVIRSIDQALQRKVQNLLKDEVAKTLDEASIQKLILQAISRYLTEESEASESEIQLPPKQLKSLRSHLLGTLKKGLDEKGVELAPSDDLIAGFKLRLDKGRVEYDFSENAIAEAMGRLLRPSLAELLQPRKEK